MNKQKAILLQIAVWAMLLLAPLSFAGHGNGVSLRQFLLMSVSPLLMMIVFYLNFLWLTPKYLIKGDKKFYWLINIILCVGLGILLHVWMSYAHDLLDDMRVSRQKPTTLQMALFIMRDIFNLALSATIATTILLSQRWYKSEEARLEAETARTEAELRNLRNQISPHFLLNTLNNIYALTSFDSERAQDAIQQLSKMLRHMLYDNQQEEVEWEKEVQFLESYVNLMKIRLPQNVDVTFTAQHPAPVTVAPLLFISLVENAFKHGVSPPEPSFIHISLEADNQHICCDIKNSNHPKSQQDRSGHGIGLQQVQRRLDLSYPGRYTWEQSLSPDGQTYQSRIVINLRPSPIN